MLKKLPLGIQTFSELITENYIYVDKTEYIHKLMQGKYYFFSRPRRFGKSLLISTMKEIFAGNKELFQGLWIYDKIEWIKYPVIYIDFTIITHSKGPDNFEENINNFLDKIAKNYGLVIESKDNKEKIYELVENLHDKYGKVVILIDEYDKPIIDYIENTEQARENKDILASFYETIKYLDGYLKFVFITGVSKFSKVSIFSKLNNLKDITRRKEYAIICGYTQEELEKYFAEHIEICCEEHQTERSKLLKKIKYWYNGYSWSEKQLVYNPYAVLNLFDSMEFQNYWFQTATPGFLIKLIKEQKMEIEDFEGYKAGSEIFDSFELEKIDPVSLLYQTGYLTVKKERNRVATFGYPNYEVKESFLVHILAAYTDKFASKIKPIYLEMLEYMAKEKLPQFQTALTALFAGVPYQLHLEHESYYHSLCYLILALLGADIMLEESTDKGRIDAVLEFENLVYIIEFKMDTAAEAMAQIKDRRYYEKYVGDSRKIILLGIGGLRQKALEVVSEVWEENQ